MEKKEAAKPPTFNKEQLIKSKKFAARRDLLSALLANDKQYTMSEVESIIKAFDEKETKYNKKEKK